ncbi:MAG: PadR family transcriptional regulator [Anaerolineae bacterium]|nr:PadR family transcriptional regulator [Anaerolineae bacterium]
MRTNIRYLILGLLNQQPMSGYDVKRFLESLSWLVGSPSFGSIYPTLRSLLQHDLVTMEAVLQEDKPPRKIYSITAKGAAALDAWVNKPLPSATSMKGFLMRLILAGSFSPARLTDQMKERRAQVATQWEALKQAVDTVQDPGQRLALEYGCEIASAELAWLDQTLGQIGQQLTVEDVGTIVTP